MSELTPAAEVATVCDACRGPVTAGSLCADCRIDRHESLDPDPDFESGDQWSRGRAQ